jgi:hypothetical protein
MLLGHVNFVRLRDGPEAAAQNCHPGPVFTLVTFSVELSRAAVTKKMVSGLPVNEGLAAAATAFAV